MILAKEGHIVTFPFPCDITLNRTLPTSAMNVQLVTTTESRGVQPKLQKQNMDVLNNVVAPARAKLRQFHKMVQDMKATDGDLLSRLKRQTGNPAPKVPARDYRRGRGGKFHDANNADNAEDGNDQRSEPEFENGIYEDPLENHDDSYELPPIQLAFSPRPLGTMQREQYIDSCRGRNNGPPTKPLRLQKRHKPLQARPDPTLSKPIIDDDDDYVNPKSDTDDDYVEPAEAPPTSLYEVPTIEVIESRGGDEYEVCDPDNNFIFKPEKGSAPVMPKPTPRGSKQPHLSVRPRPNIHSRESNGPSLPGKNISQKPSATAPPSELKRPKIPVPQSFTNQKQVDTRSSPTTNLASADHKAADVLGKSWYAKSCDRKTAEDALIRSNKEGSFLVRQSSGQDAMQPYTLVVYYNSRVYNIPVRHIPASEQYAIGREKKGEERFRSVSHIIEHHERNSLVLIDSLSNSKDATRLGYPVQP